jgi:chromosome segregation ATPase
MRLEEEVRGMVEAMGEGARERDRLDESVREAMAMCDRLAKDNKLLEKKVEKLKEDLAVTDKILNKTNSDTSILKTNNTDLKSSVTHYKSVLCDLEKHLFDLRSL